MYSFICQVHVIDDGASFITMIIRGEVIRRCWLYPFYMSGTRYCNGASFITMIIRGEVIRRCWLHPFICQVHVIAMEPLSSP